MIKVLLICGVSGSGKSFIETMLSQRDFRKPPYVYFNKLRQVTTRQPRNEDEIKNKTYNFISEEVYDKISGNLFAKTVVNGKRYGTLNTIMESEEYTVVNTIIVNRIGWQNVIDELIETFADEVQICTLQICCKPDDCESRSDRDVNFLIDEQKSISKISDLRLNNDKDNRLKSEDIIKALQKRKFI